MRNRNMLHGTGDTLHINGLSQKFWQLADALTAGWEMMNQLLEQEWQILRSRKIKPAWHLGQQKEKLAGQLKAIEERIDLEIPGLDRKNPDADSRWKALLSQAHPSERGRLITWKTTVSTSKKRAFITNRRLWIWINEQQELSRKLTAILSGRQRAGGITYSMDGTFNEESSATASRANTGDTIFAGFSQERITHALEAYRAADTTKKRVESWD